MTIHTERQREIERMLCEEYEAEGYQIIDDAGERVALVQQLVAEGLKEFAKINLSRLAEQIEEKLG